MKREIVKKEGRDFWQKLVGKYLDEEVKIVDGKARDYYMCDFSGQPIFAGDDISCISVSTPTTPYFPWESDYLTEPKTSEEE